ncbi:MAG: HAMP domain-containing histidine kinase [candidate division Zixibacteria bacterium]|nr:HAMP domain-containing histidine kinase [candidate division Zixibacteria bacterium]
MAKRWRLFRGTSDLYIGKSTLFKSFLLVGVAAISATFIWYTLTVIDQLKRDTRSQVGKYVMLWQFAANTNISGPELQFIFDSIIVKATFPIIVVDNDRIPRHWRNIHGIEPTDTTSATIALLKEEGEEMRRENGEFPIHFGENYVNYLYYGNPELVERLQMMPFVEIGLVLAFMLVGVIGFQNIRRSEERLIWVGMAKETAHQLGTPISSLMGWTEMLASDDRLCDPDNKKALAETIENMSVDIERLHRVANRFGQIGSVPELTPSDLNRTIRDTVTYFKRRLPFEGKGIQLTFTEGPIPHVPLNTELFSWALENLVKNALQAVDARTGRVSLSTALGANGRTVVVEIAYNGSVIPAAAVRKIFRPGFSTKKRGWGMGLTLVKRIIEEYHAGIVLLLRSKPGETVFQMELPVVNSKG